MTHRFVELKSNVDIESSAREYLETLIICFFLQKSEYESKGYIINNKKGVHHKKYWQLVGFRLYKCSAFVFRPSTSCHYLL